MDKPADDTKCKGEDFVGPGSTDVYVQLAISLTMGLSAFLSFCALRPRWKTLYAARKRTLPANIAPPPLPDSFFGWIPALYKITEEQVIASAGLDAFVFLRFFNMSIRLFASMLFFAAVVLLPVNDHFVGPPYIPRPNPPDDDIFSGHRLPTRSNNLFGLLTKPKGPKDPDDSWNPDKGYLWSYLIFTWFFTFLAIYYMNSETFNVIQTRQDYLGTQSTLTDRTFRLAGIPPEYRSEAKIKDMVERVEIGSVESVTLCRNWRELDQLMVKRQVLLRKLEESWTVYRGQKPSLRPRAARTEESSNGGGSENESADEDTNGAGPGEGSSLLGQHSGHPAAAVVVPVVERSRPMVTLRYGLLWMRARKTDAIDYYEEKLRQLDIKIVAARGKTYDPTGVAFVTMDSTAACQMAIQALLDPHPGRFLTKPAPAPTDIIWENTYLPRYRRRFQRWSITFFIGILTIVWLVPVASLASLLSICTIRKISSPIADSLLKHGITKALVQTGLPTAVVSLLNIAVPYLYSYLSYNQGTISRGDIELSIISKNFFFTFFNIFLVFAVFGTATSIWSVIYDSLSDSTKIAKLLADKVKHLVIFYLNFIMLQGIGLFPLRLLEFGSVSLYPIARLGARTPRDYAEIDVPPTFSYGFYLPTALLIYILCMVYSVLPEGVYVLACGLIYFVLGYFTYKYQLLYAMDQPQHADGGAWRLICHRIYMGLLVFQLAMSGVLAIESALTEALLVIPLGIVTVWYGYYWNRRYDGLTRFIALRSISGENGAGGGGGAENVANPSTTGPTTPDQRRDMIRRLSTIDEEREEGKKFVNPSLTDPLQQPWIYKDPPPLLNESGESVQDPSLVHMDSATSSVSLGDTHVWRDAGDNNV